MRRCSQAICKEATRRWLEAADLQIKIPSAGEKSPPAKGRRSRSLARGGL